MNTSKLMKDSLISLKQAGGTSGLTFKQHNLEIWTNQGQKQQPDQSSLRNEVYCFDLVCVVFTVKTTGYSFQKLFSPCTTKWII